MGVTTKLHRRTTVNGSIAGSRPPGPSLAQLTLAAGRMRGAGYSLLPEMARRYGDVVSIPMPPVPGWKAAHILVSHPDHVEHVMSINHATYPKHLSVQQLVVDEPLSLPLQEGAEWKRTRLAVSPFFTEQALAGMAPRMTTAAVERVGAWSEIAKSGEYVNLEHELGVAVMDGVMRALFDSRLPTIRLSNYVEAIRHYGFYVISRSATYALPRAVPRPYQKRGESAKAYIMAELDRVIAERRSAAPRVEADVLDTLEGMTFAGCPAHQYRRLRSELASLVFAFETTAQALAWTIALLCLNPSALARAYAEVDALGGREISYAEVDQLEYLRASFDEAQRIQGAPINIRTSTEVDEIGGYVIPEGSNVLISPFGLHHDPRFWKQPDVFEPRRFLDDAINRYAFLPFSIGPRKCLGARMAYIQSVITLGTILQRYSFTIRDGWKPRRQLRVSTGLAGGLPVRVTARNAD